MALTVHDIRMAGTRALEDEAQRLASRGVESLTSEQADDLVLIDAELERRSAERTRKGPALD